ncbi:MerR family transcriptional regulator [Actinobaculum sp. 352]|uniref:MerR family transcriptional regulator n=1 Tax=Actinobaculum sp. 352 TaxID=2490946 RepID=UPI0019CFBDBF|nr:MerR family transcriptional regulator [Actinobaculum sp. 352]
MWRSPLFERQRYTATNAEPWRSRLSVKVIRTATSDINKTKDPMEIGEFSTQVGLPTSTLHYYERCGLLSPARNKSGHRDYSSQDVAWVQFICRLKATGMPLADIKRYADLRARGDETLAERMAMLHEHRKNVEQEIARWQENLGRLEHKIDHYQKLLKARPSGDHTEGS